MSTFLPTLPVSSNIPYDLLFLCVMSISKSYRPSLTFSMTHMSLVLCTAFEKISKKYEKKLRPDATQSLAQALEFKSFVVGRNAFTELNERLTDKLNMLKNNAQQVYI